MFTFITSNSLERQFYTKENKFTFTILNYFLLFIFSPTFVFISWSISLPEINNFLFKYLGWILLIYVLLVSIIVTRRNSIKKKSVLNLILKLKLNKLLFNSKLSSLLFILYILFTLVLCGLVNSTIILEDSSVKLRSEILLLFVAIELYIIFISIRFGTNTNLNKSIPVIIKMENGDIYENHYIYYPTKNNFLLIGKESESILCSEPILIPINKIAFCKQINHIVQSKKEL